MRSRDAARLVPSPAATFYRAEIPMRSFLARLLPPLLLTGFVVFWIWTLISRVLDKLVIALR